MALSRREIMSIKLKSLVLLAAGGGLHQQANGASDPRATVRTLEDFGARGDFDFTRNTGTDDTQAIQQAIDWAYAGGNRAPRAIAVGAANYLCGQITVRPTTTLIGTGRQTSCFVCASGTKGEWWSDRRGGAQKLMLSGLAWYGRGERGLTHICRFGSGGIQFGTEGVLEGLWMRDAPEGYALMVDANVGILRNITLSSSAGCLHVRGNANQLDTIVCMEGQRVGADLAGCFVRGLHLEAIGSGGSPLILNGDCRVRDVMISSAADTTFDHLIRVETGNYDEWAVEGVHLLGNPRITRGMIRAGGQYLGGTDAAAFTGASHVSRLATESGRFALGGQQWQSFSAEIARRNGTLSLKIGTLGNPSIPNPGALFAQSATPAARSVDMPLGRADSPTLPAPGVVVANERSRIILNYVIAGGPAANRVHVSIERSTAGRALTVSSSAEIGARGRLSFKFCDAQSGEPFDLTTLPDGATIQIACSGFM